MRGAFAVTAHPAGRCDSRSPHLAELHIEQNLQDRESQTENSSAFLDTQLEQAKQRPIEQEKKLEDYRKAHSGQLPAQLQGNLQAIQNANLQLQQLNEASSADGRLLSAHHHRLRDAVSDRLRSPIDDEGGLRLHVFERGFQDYGLPEAIRTDDGVPCASAHALYG